MIESDSEYLDFSHVPASRGVPKLITYAGLIGLLMIFIIGGLTAYYSGYGHKWPAAKTMRYDLGPLQE